MPTDIEYTQATPQGTQGNLLDLLLPAIRGNNKAPLLIWHSGSGWLSDCVGKTIPPDILDFFLKKGYAVAAVNVRSSSQVTFPGQLLDIRAAVRWLRTNAGAYRIDPDRFAIMGTSSGGWGAAIAATTSDIWKFEGETNVQASSAVQAAVPFFAPIDFLQMDAWYAAHPEVHSAIVHNGPHSPESLLIGCPIQTCRERASLANPIRYINGNEPLTHLFHGSADPYVPHGQSELLYNALAKAGDEVWFTSIPNGFHDHTSIINASDYTVYRTNRDGQESVWTAPDTEHAPTLVNIELFISNALNRAQGNAKK